MTSEILRNEECNPNLLKKKGLELLDAGKTNEAVECFSKGLVYAPFDSLMRFWRGRKLIGRAGAGGGYPGGVLENAAKGCGGRRLYTGAGAWLAAPGPQGRLCD